MFMRRHLISGKNRPGSALSVKSITIHETANPAEGADAAMHRDYAQRNDRNVSYHWVVDDKEAIQVIPDTEIAWHSGTAEGNRTSLSIEICENRDGDPVARYEHAVWLSAYLLHKHGLGTEELVTHKHWSGKDCPRHLLNVWDTFKKDVNEQLRSMKKQKTPILGSSVAAAEQMRQYLKSIHPQAPDYVSLYLQMEKEEGVRADVAFAQSILETNAWRFGGTVTPDMNNFAGLGASENPPGYSFETPGKGIMAQGRHLRLYARYLPHLNDRNVDPKGLPPSLLGWAPFLEDLTGKWAVDIVYGYKIRGILQKIIEEPAGGTDEAHWAEPQIEKLKQRGIILHDHHPEETVVFGVLATMLNRVLDQTTE